MAANLPGLRLLIIDDDALTCEVLSLLAEEAGFVVSACESGEAALEAVAAGARPDAVLADQQLPGISGGSLAGLLRSGCGPQTKLLAMSGSAVAAELLGGYDGFLLKPFTVEELLDALAGGLEAATEVQYGSDDAVLNARTYESLRLSMGEGRLRALYSMCLEDADSRIGTMRRASARRDLAGYRSAAHAIKGGCGMVGAVELLRLAGVMESGGLPAVGDEELFTEFLAALARLRRILDARLA